MKKILRTFLITIALVVLGGLIGGYFYLQNNPAKLQQLVGCNALNDDQKDFNQQLADAINDLRQNDVTILNAIEGLYGTPENVQNVEENIVEPTEEKVEPTEEKTETSNKDLNNAVQAADEVESN